VLIAADIGPRGDGYRVEDAAVSVEAAREYHELQIRAVAEAGVDLVCAWTMTGLAESIGIVEAAVAAELPIIVSPTVETDGRLPDGSGLGEFIRAVDEATTAAPLFYMVNCAHPTHLTPTLADAREAGASWLERFSGLRANASKKSHEELDGSSELDRGDVRELAREVAAMRETYGLRVIGGCCGTDVEHLAAIAAIAAG
jgi:S-methylmethionine-dependent homocysteine/selenocysteine methylase